MSERALRWVINGAGIACFYAFLSIRILPLFNAVLCEKYIPEYWENTRWGELYYFNFIHHFREENLPDYSEKYRFSERHPELNDADILTFGDSFFDFSRMTTFPEQLGDSLNKKIHYVRMDQPLRYLAEHNYKKTFKKYLIYETAERFLHDRFEKQHQVQFTEYNHSGLRKTAAGIRDFVFSEDTELLYNQLLNRSYLTSFIYSAISTIKFNLFGQITNTTPLYSLEHDIPWLFAGLQVGDTPRSFYYQHSQEEIDNYCDNIQKLSRDLKETCNLEFVFMIIPSKYTIYHTLLNEDPYNNYIPKMYEGLEARGIPVIRIYDEFKTRKEERLLYYGTDTHWTEEGLNIALNKGIRFFNSVEYSDSFARLTDNTIPVNP